MSGDLPDVVQAAKTPVIGRLIGLVSDRFDQSVVSLNRRSPGVPFALTAVLHAGNPPLKVQRVPDHSTQTVLYHAPRGGIFHRTMLLQLGDWLASEAARTSLPDLLVAWKLGIEGIAVARAAALLGRPYALVIQGNTDLRVLQARPDLRRSLARVFNEAAVVFALAPWALAGVERLLGPRAGPKVVLPCPMAQDGLLIPRVGDGAVLSAFHLRNWRIKNAGRLIAAAARVPDMQLAIVGGGSERETAALESLSRRSGALVTLEGALEAAAMPARMNASVGFAMPSLRESFGLVFLEALFAGTPIVYPRGAAIDGYFEGAPFAIPVDARDNSSIAEGLMRLRRDEATLKRSLAEWQNGPGPYNFRATSIARCFGDNLKRAMSRA